MKKLIGILLLVSVLVQQVMAQNKAPKDCSIAEIDSIIILSVNEKNTEKILDYAAVGIEKAAAQYGKTDTIYAQMQY